MDITKFYEKYNKLDSNIYTVEEVVSPVNGVYEAPLHHDNVTKSTVNVYTGSKLTGDKINTFVLSTPSLTPWKYRIRIFSDITPLYISYETIGDEVEAEDINNLQNAVNDTQTALNDEITRATKAENQIENKLKEEISRAKSAESVLTSNLNSEITRATKAENTITNTINANKSIWDDKYTRNEIDNKFSVYTTNLDWKESVATYSAIATTYPNPDDGWTVNAKDTDITYRYTGSSWIAISANAIPLATSSLDGKMSSSDKTKLDGITQLATKTAKSSTNGNVKINDTETVVYTHPATHSPSIIVQDFNNRFVTDTEITSWNNKLDSSANAVSASKLANARTISVTGDATGSTNFDGSANSLITLTLANSGVSAGTYKSVTVDSKGRVINGTNPTSLSGYGITDAVYKQTITTATDFNTLTTPGEYKIAVNSCTNSPNGNWGTLIVQYDNAVTVQLYYPDLTQTIYRRHCSLSTWSQWINLFTASNIGLGNVTNESKATMFTNPTFIGTPTAPTATSGTNTTQLATTAFVTNAVSNVTSGVVSSATKLTTARTISLTGAITGSVSFDGSANATITTKLKNGLTWNDIKGV